MKFSQLRKISTLIGTFIVQFLLGTIHTFPSLTMYLYSYIIDNTEENKIFPHTHFTLLFAFINIINGLCIPIGILLRKVYTEQTITGIGMIIILISIVILIIFPKFIFVSFALILGSIGNGLAYLPSLVSLWSYFPQNKGLVTGVALTGYGLNRLVFKYLSIEIINPKNLSNLPGQMKYPEEIGYNFKIYLEILLISYGILSFISVYLIQPFKEQNTMRKKIISNGKGELRKSHSNLRRLQEKFNPFLISKEQIDPSDNLKDALSSMNFIQLCFIFFLTMCKKLNNIL